MQLIDNQLIFSATDISRFMHSPFASWMQRLQLSYPNICPAPDAKNELLASLANRGNLYEAKIIDSFKQKALQVLTITGDNTAQKLLATRKAMAAGVAVIAQAQLQQDNFIGFADLLVKIDTTNKSSNFGNYYYQIYEIKLSKELKVEFVIQVCCYCEMLASMQGHKPKTAKFILGNENYIEIQVNAYSTYYQKLKQQLLTQQQSFDKNNRPDPFDSSNYGQWQDYANKLFADSDHLMQIANISKTQISKLHKANIHSGKQLAETNLNAIAGINNDTLTRLKLQAQLQYQSANTTPPKFTILPQTDGVVHGFTQLPQHNDLDVFFDIEGYPLVEGGLEYLWGCSYFDSDNQRQFKDFWAHNATEERQAFIDFITWVYNRWQRQPAMHIYHYGNYEIASCQRLMGKYGVCEYAVDQLLRNQVFVDLYKIIKTSLQIGTNKYSIKNVETLYRPKRDTDVGTGIDSVIVYENWRNLYLASQQSKNWQQSKILNSIRDYNIDDCNSTQELTVWLRKQQLKSNISYIETPYKEAIGQQQQQLCRQLLATAATQTGELAQLTTNIAFLIEFHRREAKPVFWRLYDRIGRDLTELYDDMDCLANCVRTTTAEFKEKAQSRNLTYKYKFDNNQDFKGVKTDFYVLTGNTTSDNLTKAKFIKTASDLNKGIIAIAAKTQPGPIISLIPDEFVSANIIQQAIINLATSYADNGCQPNTSAIFDYLLRRQPKFNLDNSGFKANTELLTDIADTSDSVQKLSKITEATLRLDNSYLIIQGPPGSGKTYTAKHIIAGLIQQKQAKVAISSNSHKAINNLVTSCYELCRQQNIKAMFSTAKLSLEMTTNNLAIKAVTNNKLIDYICDSCVMGTTAWGFSRSDVQQQYDYLFIDEAGQVSVANLFAMSSCAKNIVLLGDQMQLGQPTQSVHPEQSGLSILDYLLGDKATVSNEQGIFLANTYRMHPNINQWISANIYQGKLNANSSTQHHYLQLPKTKGLITRSAGIEFIGVDHSGNSQASDEEVAIIAELTEQLLNSKYSINGKDLQAIDYSNILYLAPYNHQVNKLQQKLGGAARVGSVDKFQGQEAAVVIISMCASTADASNRGIDFLLDKNRLNVAISRAKCLAIVVANPNLTNTVPNNLHKLKLLNLFESLKQFQ